MNPEILKQCGETVAKLMQARTVAHVMHLDEDNYARHIALGEFYEGVGGLTDDIAETMQGCAVEKLTVPVLAMENIKDAAAENYLDEVQESVAALREMCADMPVIQNQCDEVTALIRKTQYKLEFLG